MNTTQPTACIIVIGNEILSGRTQDTNTHWMAGQLTSMGIRLCEARVIPDIKQTIIEVVGQAANTYDYVFTTGGIGPTHDDITADAIAALFQAPLVLHPEAHARLAGHYGDQLNEARLKMGYIPTGATLIDNPVSAAPGFRMHNVFVMAGVPSIMRAMFDGVKSTLKGGAPILSNTVSAAVTEGVIAKELTEIQQRFPNIEIGSYPFIKNGTLGVSIVLRGIEKITIEKAAAEVQQLLSAKGELMGEEQSSS